MLSSPQTALPVGLLTSVSDSAKWYLQAHDDTPLGWLATGVYVLLCILCWREVFQPQIIGRKIGKTLHRPSWISSKAIQAGVAAAGAIAAVGLALSSVSMAEPLFERLIVLGFSGMIVSVFCVLCWRELFRPQIGRRENGNALRQPQWIWISLGVTVVGINKQLDLQSIMIQLGRRIAEVEGLMQYRRLIQAGFTVGGAIAAAAVGLKLWRYSRRATSSERLVIFGLLGLIGFVMLRVSQFNHVNLLGEYLMHHLPIRAFEVAASLFLCLAVWRNRRQAEAGAA